MTSDTRKQQQAGLAQYLVIAETISGWIRAGRYKTGDAIATVAELAEQFGVARGTIQEALKELSDRGVIVTARGKRSTVRRAPQIRPVFAGMNLRDSLFVDKIGARNSQPLSIKTVEQSADLIPLLDFDPGEKLIEYRFLSFLNGRPNALVTALIPCADGSIGPGTGAAELSEAILRVLDTAKCQERRVSALMADFEIAEHLKISIGTPVLRYRCLVSQVKEKLDLYFEQYLRSDDCEYLLDV
jgi:DNA-binding GntR family transcriptional regulator